MTRPAPTLFPLAPKLKESDLQLQIQRLFVAAGMIVYSTSQGFRREKGGTRTSAGIPDLIWFAPSVPASGFFEVKTPEGLADHYKLIRLPKEAIAPSRMKDWRRAKAQEIYRNACKASGTPYAIGDMDAARQALLSLELAEIRNGVFTLTPMARTRRPTPQPQGTTA